MKDLKVDSEMAVGILTEGSSHSGWHQWGQSCLWQVGKAAAQ